MQDRFKFRAWSLDYSMMIYSDDKIDAHFDGFFLMFEQGNFTLKEFIALKTHQGHVIQSENIRSIPAICMQCTGLRDKNNKLIYEGDILKFYFFGQEYISDVTWSEDNAWWNCAGHPLGVRDLEKTEILGNVYENLEL